MVNYLTTSKNYYIFVDGITWKINHFAMTVREFT